MKLYSYGLQFTRPWRFLKFHRCSVLKTRLSIWSSVLTICCSSWFVFVRYRLLSGIIKQVTRPWRFLWDSSPQRVENYLCLIRRSFVYGIGFSQISSSRLPVLDDVVNSSPQDVENYFMNTKPYSYELLLLVVRICTLQGSIGYRQAGYPSLDLF